MRTQILLLALAALVLTAAASDGQRFTMITNNTTVDQYPRVNEDGTVFTWVGGSDAWVWDGGPAPRQLTSVGNIPIPYDLTISGDGRTVGFISNRSVWTVPTAGGTPVVAHNVVSPDSTSGPLTLSYDGSLICFNKYDSTTKAWDQWVAKTDGTSAWNATNRMGTSFHDREAWMSADGKSVVYTALVGSARNVWIVNTDGTNPRVLTTFTTAGNIRFPVVDRFSKIVAYGYEATSSIYQIYTVPTSGGASILVSKSGADSWMPYLSELDGEKVSFKTQELGSSQQEVFLAWSDGQNRRQVTNFQGGETRLTNSSHALNGDGTIGVYVTSQNFGGQNPTGDREIILWHDALTRTGPVAPGATVNLILDVPSRPNDVYLVRCSFNRSPGIPIPGVGTAPLNPDVLFFLSGALPGVFQKFAGTLDQNGMAAAAIAVPKIPSLSGIRFYAAFAAVGPAGIFLSDSLSLTVL